MADKKITGFTSGSINDLSLGIVGDPSTGALSQTGYKAMKDYFTAGITGSGGNVNTGSLATTASLNSFTASYVVDSASFNTRINSITGSTINTGSLATTASLNALSSSFVSYSASYVVDSASIVSNINTINNAGGKYVLTSSFLPFSSSYVIDSGSINNKIVANTTSIINAFASESNYTPTASFNPFTSSYIADSASFNNRIINLTGSGGNVSVVTFNAFSSSYVNDSSSFAFKISGSIVTSSFFLVYSGQSNTGGGAQDGLTADTASDPRLFVWDYNTIPGVWKVAKIGESPFNITFPVTGSPTHWFYFGRKLARDQNKKVYMVGNFANAMPISQWFTGGAVNTASIQLVQNVISSSIPRTDLFVWDQGESDTVTNPLTYIQSWEGVKAYLRSQSFFEPTTPIVVVGMPQVSQGAPTGSQGIDPTLQAFDVAGDMWVGYANTDSASVNPFPQNNLHFNSKGYQYIGEQSIWATWQAIPFNNYQRNNPGGVPPGSTISPGLIQVSFNSNAGQITDGIKVQNTSNTGTQGVHVYASDTSSIGFYGCAGSASSYFKPNVVVLGSESNSDVIFFRQSVNFLQLSGSGVVLNQALTVNPITGTPSKFINIGASSGPTLQLLGDSSNFVSIQLNNTTATNPNSFALYVINGYKLFANGTGVSIFTPSATAQFHIGSGSTAAKTAPLKINGGSSMTAPESGSLEYDNNNFYLTTGSIRQAIVTAISGAANYQTIFGSNSTITSSIMYQSGSSTLIGNTIGSNNAALQVFGGTYLSGSLFDSTNSTGSSSGSYVLTSTPAGPVWTGAPVYIATGQISSSLSQSISFGTTNYSTIEIELLTWQPVTAGSRLTMTVSSDGVNFDGGAAAYEWGTTGQLDGSPVPTGSSADTSIQLGGTSGVGNTSGRSISVYLKISNPGGSFQPTILYQGNSINNSGNFFNFYGGGVRVNSQVTKAVKFQFSSGNIATGLYRVIGHP